MDELATLLPRFFNKHVRGDHAPVLEVLLPLWPWVAGKAMAEQSRPVAFANGILTLAAFSAPWVTELRGLHDEIRTAINRTLGRPLVKRVRVKLAPLSGPDPGCGISSAFGFENGATSARQAFPALPMPGQAPASIHDPGQTGLQASLDPEIREVLSRSFTKYFARGNRMVN